MFDFFDNMFSRRKYSTDDNKSDLEKVTNDMNKVVKFPELKSVPPMPEVTPPKEQPPGKIFYRLGLTDNNRVAFSMGYSEVTMNREGIQRMIDQLAFYRDQLDDEDEE